MKELNEGIVSALRALPTNATTLQSFKGAFAVFAQQPVPADVADFSPATATAPSLYIVVGPTIDDSNPPDKEGDQREIVTQITIWGKKQYNSAGALDSKAREIREELHRRADKIVTTGTVTMFEVQGVTDNDVDFWWGRVIGVRVLFEWFGPQTQSLELDGAAQELRYDNGGVGIVGDFPHIVSLAIWHKPDAAFGSRNGVLFECWEAANPTQNIIYVKMRHELTPDRVTVKLTDQNANATEFEYNNLVTLGAWNLTAFDFGEPGDNLIKLYQGGAFVAETTIVTADHATGGSNPKLVFRVGTNYLGRIHSIILTSQRWTAAQHAAIAAAGIEQDARDIRWSVNEGAILKHWWRPGHDRYGIGRDWLFQRGYGETASPVLPADTIDLMTEAVGIDATNIVTDAPA